MTQRTRFTAYITKFALTSGIMEREVEDCFDTSPNMISVVGTKYPTHYHKGDWFRSMAEAVAKAESMRSRKIVSLEASIAKIKALKF